MKKIATILTGLVLTATTAVAQLPNGSTAPDWTFTDINSNTWNLYTILAQGKTVFIDVSATWCGPCWNYHNSKALDSLYTYHGPSGTIDQMCQVFFIEGDGTTTSADLNGTGTNTQGNWVAGTPFPIIDPPTAQINPFNTAYAIAYFPTIYMICPDKKIYEVGQSNYSALVYSMNTCSYPLDILPASASSIACSTNYTPQFMLKNNSISAPLTSCTVTYKIDNGSILVYNWSGNLAAGQSTSVSLTPQTLTAGNHTFYVTTSSPNGTTDNNMNNDEQAYPFTIITAGGIATPYSQAFGATTFPYANWAIENPDANMTWTHVTTNTGSLEYNCYNYANRGAKDGFIVEPFDLTGLTSASLKFDVAHAQYDPTYFEGLDVFVSTDCGLTWTSVYSKLDPALATVAASTAAFTPSSFTQWRTECVNLSAYVGSAKVFVKFVGTNDYGNNMYVDNIMVSNVSCLTGIIENTDHLGFSLFPNPAQNNVNLSFDVNNNNSVSTVINIYNMVGALVSSISKGQMAAGKQIVNVSTQNLDNGVYMIELVSGEYRSVKRLTISH